MCSKPRHALVCPVTRWCSTNMRTVGSIFIMTTLRMVTSTWWSPVNFWPSAVPGTTPKHTTKAAFSRLTTSMSSECSKYRRLCG